MDMKQVVIYTHKGVLLFFGIWSFLSLFGYIFLLAFSIVRTFTERSKLGEKSKRIIGFGCLNFGILLVFVIMFGVLLFNGYDSSQLYLASIGCMNIYTFAMAILMTNKDDATVETKRKRKTEIIENNSIELRVDEYGDDDMIIKSSTSNNAEKQAILDDGPLDL